MLQAAIADTTSTGGTTHSHHHLYGLISRYRNATTPSSPTVV